MGSGNNDGKLYSTLYYYLSTNTDKNWAKLSSSSAFAFKFWFLASSSLSLSYSIAVYFADLPTGSRATLLSVGKSTCMPYTVPPLSSGCEVCSG